MRYLVVLLLFVFCLVLGFQVRQIVSQRPSSLTSIFSHLSSTAQLAGLRGPTPSVQSSPSPFERTRTTQNDPNLDQNTQNTQENQKDSEKRKEKAATLAKLNDQIDRIEKDQSQRQGKLQDLEMQITTQVQTIQELKEAKTQQAGQAARNVIQSGESDQEQNASEQAVVISQLEQEISKSQAAQRALAIKVQQYSNLGFDTDALASTNTQYQAELKRYQTLQANLIREKAKAREAASVQELNRQWQQKMSEQALEDEYRPQIESAKARLKDLESSYSKLQLADQNQQAELSKVYQAYTDQRNSDQEADQENEK